jgi:hypothetical protein
MLEMYKYILGKVSFDKVIFKKELAKAMKSLQKEEAKNLKKWCSVSFDSKLIKECDMDQLVS